MSWTMPRKVLQIVAGLIGLMAVGAFAMGVINAPQRGRLPGERAAEAGGVSITAAEATPLSQERIEGPPPPPELTPEEKAKLEAEKKAKEEADAAAKALADAEAAAKAATPAPAPPVAPAATPPGDRVGDLLDGVTPPPDDPPH